MDQSFTVMASEASSSDLVDVDPDTIAPGRALGRRTQTQFGTLTGAAISNVVSIGVMGVLVIRKSGFKPGLPIPETSKPR